ncbi:OLC1v1005150C1 [Oldenlandia corymbosa var. corymbosa]|uniref:OLC1v1005150C1 n=1 Tax=Oldenlandia corymbosa var. corymbosa TaxID=529605 RepID=A0AAV1DHF2_OLDCO|nr:OLC1v1005150C1 [Oldenlandia corymbosa var. corymbosa]
MYYNESTEQLLTFTQRNTEIDGDQIKPVPVAERRIIITHTTTIEVQSNKNLTIRPERRNEEDDIHEIMPLTTNLVCFCLAHEIKFLNPMTRQIATVDWPKIMDSLENCAKAFEYISSRNEYTFMSPCFPPNHGYFYRCTLSFEPCLRINQLIDKPRSCLGPESTELLVSFDTEMETFQLIHAPPTPIFVTVNCFPRVKILDYRETMCVTKENYIYMRDMNFEMWAWESGEDNSESWRWRRVFENRNFSVADLTVYPGTCPYNGEWVYPVILSHKSSPTGEFILKGIAPFHL